MIKEDLSELFRNLKSIFLLHKRITKKNLFIIFSAAAFYFTLFFIDPEIRYLFLKARNPFLDFIFNIAHFYGKLYLILFSFIFLYLVGLILKQKKIKKYGLLLFQSFLFSGLIVTIIKLFFGRWRPYTEHGHLSFVFFTIGPNDHLSLPSGDVAVAFAFSTVAASVLQNKLWKIFWYGIAVLTSLGRIYHDQHWFTDVILAAAISISITQVILKNSFRDGYE